ncbi:MAG: pseudouridine synthase [Balneolaceae bacterium]
MDKKKRPGSRSQEKSRPGNGKSNRGGSRSGRSGRKDSGRDEVGKRPSGSKRTGTGRPERSSRSSRPGQKRSGSSSTRQSTGASGLKKARRPKPGSSSGVRQKEYLREEIRINKYIAHSGLCSRRDADEYILQGKVFVNGERVTEPGVKVKASDQLVVDGQRLSLEPFVYILLNKSKDTISTTDDERDRNTVLDAVEEATGYRVYPVGRLDRDTMGLLILTNDGDLAHRLMHPSYRVQKVYEVTAEPAMKDSQLEQLVTGVELEDGPARASQIQRDPMDAATVQISVFEGRNHLIRRMVSHFGSEVVKLKRVQYAGLTDKDLRMGRWRFLQEKEVNNLRKLVKLDTLDFNKK